MSTVEGFLLSGFPLYVKSLPFVLIDKRIRSCFSQSERRAYSRYTSHLFVPILSTRVKSGTPTRLSGEINSLESVQKFALRMCTKQWNSSYDDLLQLCSLPTLQQCRLYLDLCTMFKIVQGLFCRANSQTHKVTVSPSLCLSTCTYKYLL